MGDLINIDALTKTWLETLKNISKSFPEADSQKQQELIAFIMDFMKQTIETETKAARDPLKFIENLKEKIVKEEELKDHFKVFYKLVLNEFALKVLEKNSNIKEIEKKIEDFKKENENIKKYWQDSKDFKVLIATKEIIETKIKKGFIKDAGYLLLSHKKIEEPKKQFFKRKPK